MGNQKQKWTAEEEEALLAGVAEYGPGKWKNILKDPKFAPSLTHRSNIDLKDKWRNLSASTGSAQGSKDNVRNRNPKLKAIAAAPVANVQNDTPAAPRQNAASDALMDDASQNAQDVKLAPQYYAMIIEAVSSMNDANGSDVNAITSFIEQRHDNPPNFKRGLSTRLKRLVAQGKLEKVQNGYKIKDPSSGTKTPAPLSKDVLPQQAHAVAPFETIKDIADSAAYRVAEAENKSFVAAEAVKKAESISKLAEDADSMLQLVKDIYEKCSRGDVFLA